MTLREEGSEEDFDRYFSFLLQEVGFPEKKAKLLRALIALKSGSAKDIAKKAELELDSDVYAYLHDFAKIDGIREIRSIRGKREFYEYYVESTQKIIDYLYNSIITKYNQHKREIDQRLKEISDTRERAHAALAELFKKRTGIDYTVKEKAISQLESPEGVINLIDFLLLNSRNRVWFLGGSGRRTKEEIVQHISAPDIKFILDKRNIGEKELRKLNLIKNILGERFNFKLIESPIPHIRLLIADNRVLLFKWSESSSSIAWAFRFENDEEAIRLFSLIFKHLWEKY